MDDLKPIIAKNIIELRKSMNFTQMDLAQKMNYSDKAVSKWERAESIPDISVLKEMADLFGVTVDYLLVPEHPKDTRGPSWQMWRNRPIITLLSITLVFLIATLLFAGYGIFSTPLRRLWIIYVYAVPVAATVSLVLNSIWGRYRAVTNYIIISVLIWSLLVSVYLSYLPENLWLIFTPGIPAQIFVVLWSKLRFRRK
jgi:Predicted transcription factor, homolog of eukaryotic MBF1